MEKLANLSGVAFSDEEGVKTEATSNKSYVVTTSFDAYKNLKPVKAVDKDGNEITDKLTKVGATPSSFEGETRLPFSEYYYYLDSDDNLSYFVRAIDFQNIG